MVHAGKPDPFILRQLGVRIVYGDNFQPLGWSILNPNEYEPIAQFGIQACQERLVGGVRYVANTLAQIETRHRVGFANELSMLNKDLPLPLNAVVELQCADVLASFEALLLVSKSLLDVLCRYPLTTRTGCRFDGFHKDKNGNVGGRVLNTLQNNVTLAMLPTRDSLVDLINAHKARWIDALVLMRDNVAHTGHLENFIGFWTFLEAGRKQPYTDADVHDPELKNIGGLIPYCQSLGNYLQEFTMNFRDLVYPPAMRESQLNQLARDK